MNAHPRGESRNPAGSHIIVCLPRGKYIPGGKGSLFITPAHPHVTEMDKVYEQAFREKKSGKEDSQASARGSLAPGGAKSSDTNTRKGPLPRVNPDPQFKLRRMQGSTGR